MRKHTAKKQKLKNNKIFLKRGARLYFYMVIKRGSNGKKNTSTSTTCTCM